MTQAPRQNRRWKRVIAVYFVLLAASHLVRIILPFEVELAPGQRTVSLMESGANADSSRLIRLAYYDTTPDSVPSAEVIVVLHGSPIGNSMLYNLLPALAKQCRVVAPDFPGFEGSEHNVADYSILAHAQYTIQLLDSLGLERVHLVAYSMGGGVALHIYDLAPERVASISFVAAIGVQELELLGQYHLNHAVHGAQLAAIWTLHELLPHFGLLDNFPLNIAYARNFYDTDQRPLRNILEKLNPPVFILHGEKDKLVSPDVAREHFRIVPQSEVKWYPADHGIVMGRGQYVGAEITQFIMRVARGDVPTRQQASRDRIVQSEESFDASAISQADGITLFVLMLLIALATLVSEDLACIGAGIAASQGILGLVPAILASFLGIVVGDVLLYLGGRWIGRRITTIRPFSWFISDEALNRSARWFDERGLQIIFASRFIPGTRLPTYTVAGVIKAPFWRFLLFFLAACIVWTPVLVGIAYFLGEPVVGWFVDYSYYAIPFILALWIALGLTLKCLAALFSERHRLLLLSTLRRIRNWEFWPPYIFYIPVVVYVLFLGLRYRCLTLFTAANPGIPHGGFMGESKSAILDAISNKREHIPPYILLSRENSVELNATQIEQFLAASKLTFPIVLKPDIGERGKGVFIAQTQEDSLAYLAEATQDTIAQAYVAGQEFGIFYVRKPGEEHGRIFSITQKNMITLNGDGIKSVEQLILHHPRANCMAKFHLKEHTERLQDIPDAGEQYKLVEVGTHCRGSIFLDGSAVNTPSLEAAFNEISQSFEGFFFGRYDIRCRDIESLKNGKEFQILEVNGVTSEATHIYDPQNSLFYAYRVLFEQWRLAFQIGQKNRENGCSVSGTIELLRLVVRT